MIRLGLFFTFLVLLPVNGHSASNMKSLSLKMTTDYFVPSYGLLAKQAQKQNELWQKGCAIDKLKQAYHETTDAWAKVQHVNFGPVVMFLRRDRLYHWPERRNAVSKSLNKLLSSQNNDVLSADEFSRISVAGQGLPALERLLFDVGISDEWSCKIGQAMAANIAEITSGTAQEWHELQTVISDGKNHPIHFESMEELANRILTELLTGFQMISDQKLLLSMGIPQSEYEQHNRGEAGYGSHSTRGYTGPNDPTWNLSGMRNPPPGMVG